MVFNISKAFVRWLTFLKTGIEWWVDIDPDITTDDAGASLWIGWSILFLNIL